MFNLKRKSFRKFDFTLIITVLLLSIYGIVMIKSATLSYTDSRATRPFQVQTISTIIGFILILFLVLMDYNFIGKFYIPLYVFSVLLLLAVTFFGKTAGGAKSWLELPGGFTFQPAEIAKVGIIIFLAKYMDNNKTNINEPLTLLKIFALAGVPILLIANQPDFGTAVVFVFFLVVMLFAAGIDWRYVGYATLAAVISLPIIWFSLGEYQRNRVFNFLDPERDLSGTGYQAMQSRIAVGSGKVFGRGLFKGVQTQFGYLPEKQTDFIFAVIGEELGLIGGLALIALYLVLIYRLFKIAKNNSDMFGSLMVTGFASMFLIHIWENIGMTIGLMPITGIPLPFLSYGGTFHLINLVCIGIALSVGVNKDGLSF